MQTSELVVWTLVEQYASKTSTSLNKATKGEFDLFANLTVVIDISVALANN